MSRSIVCALLVVIALVGSGVVSGQEVSGRLQTGSVVNVVDGDTIDVLIESGAGGATYRVRYIGINTPETNEPCGSQATVANQGLVTGRKVELIRDVSDTDQFGRLLRYVFVGGTFVNAALVTEGWAEAVDYPPDSAFAEFFAVLAVDAFADNRGCWPSNVFEAPTGQSNQSTVQIVPTATMAPTRAPAGVTVTTSGTANLRGGPGTGYAITGTLSAGQTVTVQARNGDWLYLDSNRWVASWVVTVTGNVAGLPTLAAPPLPTAQPAAPAAQPAQSQPAAPGFVCNCSKTCGSMASCQEAYFQLQQCGCSARDGDGDGVPCETICPGG